MCTFKSRNDTLHTTQFKECIYSLLVISIVKLYTFHIMQHTVLGTYTRIVKTAGHRIYRSWFTLFILQQVALESVDYTGLPRVMVAAFSPTSSERPAGSIP